MHDTVGYMSEINTDDNSAHCYCCVVLNCIHLSWFHHSPFKELLDWSQSNVAIINITAVSIPVCDSWCLLAEVSPWHIQINIKISKTRMYLKFQSKSITQDLDDVAICKVQTLIISNS